MNRTELLSLPRARKDAIETGLTYYFTDKPCRDGHLNKRYARSGVCIDCAKAKQHRFADQRNALMRRWRKDNPDYYSEYKKDLLNAARMYEQSTRYTYKHCLGDDYDGEKIVLMWLKARRLTEKTGEQHKLVHITPPCLGGLHNHTNMMIVTQKQRSKLRQLQGRNRRLEAVLTTLSELR
jgi:hypothetical protein